jgi:hypothetical protein
MNKLILVCAAAAGICGRGIIAFANPNLATPSEAQISTLQQDTNANVQDAEANNISALHDLLGALELKIVSLQAPGTHTVYDPPGKQGAGSDTFAELDGQVQTLLKQVASLQAIADHNAKVTGDELHGMEQD